jgi:membrane fusion protein, multidrug efflux system
MKFILLWGSSILVAAFVAAGTTLVAAEDVEGIVQPVKQVSVSSPVFQEVINAVLVEEGDTVQQGQLLVQLRSAREELEVERTRKLIELAEFKSKGAESLARDQIVPKEKALEEKLQLDLSRLLNSAAQVALKERAIVAPISGTVVKKYKEAGESVDRVEKLVEIINIDQVYVQFYVDPKLMTSLRVDQGVQVRFPLLGPDRFESKISFIDPAIDAASQRLRVKVKLENPQHRIKAGMVGTASFEGAATK